MRNKRVPELRFAGFAGDWEERNLKEVTKKIGSGKTPKGGNSNYESQGIPLLRSQNIFNDKVNFSDVVYITEEVDEGMANSRVQQNDVLLNITGASIGRSAVYELISPANVNQHVSIIRPSEKINPYFIQLNITSGKGQKQIELNQAGGGREGLNFQQIAKMKFYFTNLREQTKIGSFFKQLDDAIALHQQELTTLKQTKQGFLQKMFPKEGESVPEVRFPGFTGEWEQRKFKDFISKAGKKNTMGENYPAYSVSNKVGLVSQSEQFDGSRLDNLDKTSYKLVNPNEFAYNPARINVGSIAFNDLNKTVIVSSLYVILKMSEELDNEFILQFIKSQFFIDEVRKNTEGSVREYLFFENFKNIKFPYTSSKDEQIKIGNFFKQLDNIITLHQRELDALKETKKAFLQKMFV